MRLLFLHGAGGYAEDQPLAAALGSALGADVELPQFPDEDMTVEAWAAPVRARLAGLDREDLVVAHSFGASILLRVLAEGRPAPGRAFLLAMPDWGPDGWQIPEYAFEGPEPTATSLQLHHCRDDEVVPFAHLAAHADRLPSAQLRVHPSGGHQFRGRVEAIAGDVFGLR